MSITLRAIEEADLEMIMNWRMDPEITKWMSTDPKLTLEGQRKWLAAIRNNPAVSYWVILVDGTPAGVINLADVNLEKQECSWGYYVGERKLRSLKLAMYLEMNLYDYVFCTLGLDKLQYPVFSMNAGVIKLHEMCGSWIVEEIQGGIVKEQTAYDITIMCNTKEAWLAKRETVTYEKIEFPKVSP